MRGPYLVDLESSDGTARDILRSVGPDTAGLERMLKKTGIVPLWIEEVKCPAANILKQAMLALGGEAVIGHWSVNCAREYSDVLLLGTLAQYQALDGKMTGQPWGLQALATKIAGVLKGQSDHAGQEVRVWSWPGKELSIGQRTLVMGILNLTPDSFSDGGRYVDPEKALQHARQMVEDGADLLDVGGESTRPGAQPVPAEAELERVMPVLERLIVEIPVPISLDTYKAQVAKEALSLGINIINDVGGGLKDPAMAATVAKAGVPVVIMHNKKREETLPHELAARVADDLAESVRIYREAGVAPEKIMLDPGIGFGKDPRGNLALLKNIKTISTAGFPILLGVSRKSFIGAVLDTPVNDRLEGSLAAAAWGVMKGVDVLRVHDVRATVRLVRVLEAIGRAGEIHG